MYRVWALYEVKPSAAELDNMCFHIKEGALAHGQTWLMQTTMMWVV
jgi:hypothetical protein